MVQNGEGQNRFVWAGGQVGIPTRRSQVGLDEGELARDSLVVFGEQRRAEVQAHINALKTLVLERPGQVPVAAAQVQQACFCWQGFNNLEHARLQPGAGGREVLREGLVKLMVNRREPCSDFGVHTAIIS